MEDQLPVYSSEVRDQLALKVVGVHELCFSGINLVSEPVLITVQFATFTVFI